MGRFLVVCNDRTLISLDPLLAIDFLCIFHGGFRRRAADYSQLFLTKSFFVFVYVKNEIFEYGFKMELQSCKQKSAFIFSNVSGGKVKCTLFFFRYLLHGLNIKLSILRFQNQGLIYEIQNSSHFSIFFYLFIT